MNSRKIKLLLDNSRDRERRFRKCGAPEVLIDKEKEIQRGLYKEKIIDYRKVFSKLLEKMRCLLI